MSKVYYSKTEQEATEREPFVLMAWAIGLFLVLIALIVGAVIFIVSEFNAGRGVSAGWAIMLSLLFISTLVYFIKEAVNPSDEENPDIYLRR